MTWVTDGSSQLCVRGNTVVCTSSTARYCNALWRDSVGGPSGEAYWKVRFDALDRGGARVGLCEPDHFGPKLECIAYNGNLTTGSSTMLTGELGPRLRSGDCIGLLVSYQGDRLRLYLYINDVCFGLACDIPADSLPSASPVVRFSDPGCATCWREHRLPSDRMRHVGHKLQQHPSGLKGVWSLAAMECGLQRINFKAVHVHPSLSYTRPPEIDSSQFIGVLKVLNSFRFKVAESDEHQLRGYGLPRPLIRGNTELMDLENNLIDLAANPDRVDVTGDRLTIDNKTYHTIWDRVQMTPPEPFVGRPFLAGS